MAKLTLPSSSNLQKLVEWRGRGGVYETKRFIHSHSVIAIEMIPKAQDS